MAVWGMHLDFSPDVAGGALFPYLEGMADQIFGMALGRGGADTIIAAMIGAIKASGGEVRLGAPVQSIAMENGAARAVVLASGERIEATRAVIANLHPRVLFGDLVPDSPPAAQRLAKLRPGPATMMIHLALNDLPAWSAGADLRRFAYVHLAPSLARWREPIPRRSTGCCRPSRASSSASRPRSTPRARRRGSMCSGCKCGSCRRASAAMRPRPLPARIGIR